MLTQLRNEAEVLFKREYGAEEKSISWSCQEKYHPGNDLVLIFPRVDFSAKWVRDQVVSLAEKMGFEKHEDYFDERSGFLILSGDKGGKFFISVSCLKGSRKSLFLLRFIRMRLIFPKRPERGEENERDNED